MNWFSRKLARTEQSTDSWHCPWFKVIEGLALNGIVFGGIAYKVEDTELGLVAVILGVAFGSVTLGSRTRGGASC